MTDVRHNVFDMPGHDFLTELSDFSGSLEDLSKLVDRLKINYGPGARVQFNAGHNNIACYIASEKVLNDYVQSLIVSERVDKQKRRTKLRKKIEDLQKELDEIKE